MYKKISDIKRIAKDNNKFQWGTSLLSLCLFTVLIACGNAIPVVGAVVISGPLTYGLTYIFYHASLKEKINLWDIFKGFENEFGENFLASILTGLYTFLWGLLFIIPGIIKGYSYAMYMYLLMREPELDANGAIAKSREYMKGNKWRLFCLGLSFIGWDFLCLITGGILSIYVAPYKHHAKTVFFNDVYNRKNGIADETDAYEDNQSKLNIDPQFVVDVDDEKDDDSFDEERTE